jgi:hypothetical protein
MDIIDFRGSRSNGYTVRSLIRKPKILIFLVFIGEITKPFLLEQVIDRQAFEEAKRREGYE